MTQHPLGTVKQGQQVVTLLSREIENEPVCRLGISKAWPGDTAYPSRMTMAVAFSSITRAEDRVQKAQGLGLAHSPC
jgi:hypothetical protein